MCWASRQYVDREWERVERSERAADPVTTPGHLRVSDADRDAVTERLRRHTADGRLTLDEFETRLEEVMAAKTGAELRSVLRELPPLADDVRRPPRHGRAVAPLVRAAVVVAALIALISLAVGHLVLWPLIPAAFFVFGGHGHHHRRHWEPVRRPAERDEAVTLI